jgi:hypothetical protein
MLTQPSSIAKNTGGDFHPHIFIVQYRSGHARRNRKLESLSYYSETVRSVKINIRKMYLVHVVHQQDKSIMAQVVKQLMNVLVLDAGNRGIC